MANKTVTEEGLVIAHLGSSLTVETLLGSTVHCRAQRQVAPIAVGDKVLWQRIDETSGQITNILERSSLLTRPGRNRKTRPVVANLDQILIVFSTQPRCDFLLLDQYLVICENRSINPLLICNKTDLPNSKKWFSEKLKPYQQLDYPIVYTSTKTGEGINQLKLHLNKHSSMLAGQSGVGKSSLTNALLPGIKLRTGPLSETSGHGKHTTTTTRLFHLSDSGQLIDSPGVAVFGLADISEKDLAYGYKEFQSLLHQCKFNDCRHVDDLGCAIVSAVKNKEIFVDRYQRYLKLRNKLPTVSY